MTELAKSDIFNILMIFSNVRNSFICLPVLALFSLTSYLIPISAYAEEVHAPASSTLDKGIQLLNEKRFDEALKAFEEAIAEDPQVPLPYYYSAVVYHIQKQTGSALKALDKAMKLAPGMPQALLLGGNILEEMGRLEQARKAYKTIVDTSKESSYIQEASERLNNLTVKEHSFKGTMLFREKRYEDAIREFQMVLSLLPGNNEALLASGLSYQRIGRLKEALDVFKKLTEVAPNNVEATLQLAITYEALADFDEAIRVFKDILFRAPDSPQAREAAKRLPDDEKRVQARKLLVHSAELINKEKWDEALKETREILLIEPENPYVLFNLGLILHQLKEDKEATSALKHAIEVDPKFEKGHFQLGVTYQDMGMYEEAASEYKKTVALGGSNEEVKKAEKQLDELRPLLERVEKAKGAKEAVEKGDVAGAIREMETLRSIRGEDIKLLTTLATLYLKAGRPKDAASVLEKAASLAPQDTEIRLSLAQIYEALKEYRNASDAYNTVAALEKDTQKSAMAREKAKALIIRQHYQEGKRLLEKGNYDDALQEMRSILDIAPDEVVALFNTGILYDRINRPGEAEAPLRQAISLAPDYFAAYIQLGVVFEKLRKFAEARDLYEKVIKIQGEGWETRIARGRVGLLKEQEELTSHLQKAIDLMEKKDFEAASKEARAVISANPGNYIGYYYLGLIMVRMGIKDEAMAALKKTTEINPGFARGYISLGDFLFEEGKYEDARNAYQQVINLGKESPETDVAAAKLKWFKVWRGTLSMTHGYNSNIAFRAKAQSTANSSYHFILNYTLLRRKEWNLSAGLSTSQAIYYSTQLQGNGYTLSLDGIRQFSGDRNVSGNLYNSFSYFEGKPVYREVGFSGTANTEPRAIPTAASLKYSVFRGEYYTNKVSNSEQHNLSVSASQKLSIKDTVSGSYSFSVYKNLDPLGSNYANRTHTLSVSYSRPLLSYLGGSVGYAVSFINYSNPDSTTFFQQFRRNTNQTINAGLSINLSEQVSVSGSYNFAYAINRTSLPPLSAEENQKLRDLLASPIPTVGGGGGYYQHNVSFSISTTF